MFSTLFFTKCEFNCGQMNFLTADAVNHVHAFLTSLGMSTKLDSQGLIAVILTFTQSNVSPDWYIILQALPKPIHEIGQLLVLMGQSPLF